MPITLGTNIASLKAQRELSKGTNALSRVFERLSSGQRINRASDDAAGLSVASSLQLSQKVFSQGVKSLGDAVSIIGIAEGGLSSISSILIRQKELAEQAANGTYSTAQRRAMNTEANKLVDEVNRIMQTTKFNGVSILSGTFTNVAIQNGFGESGSLSFSIEGPVQTIAGDGTFDPAIVSTNSAGYRPVVTDLNGDGRADLVMAFNNAFYISLANSDGTFKAQIGYNGVAFNNNGSAVGDLNGDGKLDIIGASNGGPVFTIILGNGDGTFKAPTTANATSSPSEDTYLYDINNDGNLDAIGSGGGALRIALGNGNATFKSASVYTASGATGYGVGFGDFNGDGYGDVFDGTNVLLANSDGSLRAGTALGAGTSGGTVGDVNSDGYLDLISHTQVLIGNGNGTFKAAASYGGVTTDGFTSAVDLNGDQYLDILSSNVTGGATQVKIFFGNDNGTFKAVTTLSSPGIFKATTGDINGDGAIDIVASNTGGPNITSYLGNPVAFTRMSYLDLTTQSTARSALDTLTTALDRVSLVTGQLGATQSRFSAEINVTTSTIVNYEEARSRIMNADIAQESAELTRQQILVKAGAAILAQANQVPSLALQLLNG